MPTAIAHWILLNTFTKDFRVWETPIENVLFKVQSSKIANGHSTLKFVKCTFEQNQDHVKASKKSRLPTAIAHWILLNTFTKDFRVWETPIENVLFKVVRSRRLWAKITSNGKTRSFLKNESSLKVMYVWNEVFRTTVSLNGFSKWVRKEKG